MNAKIYISLLINVNVTNIIRNKVIAHLHNAKITMNQSTHAFDILLHYCVSVDNVDNHIIKCV